MEREARTQRVGIGTWFPRRPGAGRRGFGRPRYRPSSPSVKRGRGVTVSPCRIPSPSPSSRCALVSPVCAGYRVRSGCRPYALRTASSASVSIVSPTERPFMQHHDAGGLALPAIGLDDGDEDELHAADPPRGGHVPRGAETRSRTGLRVFAGLGRARSPFSPEASVPMPRHPTPRLPHMSHPRGIRRRGRRSRLDRKPSRGRWSGSGPSTGRCFHVTPSQTHVSEKSPLSPRPAGRTVTPRAASNAMRDAKRGDGRAAASAASGPGRPPPTRRVRSSPRVGEESLRAPAAEENEDFSLGVPHEPMRGARRRPRGVDLAPARAIP